MQRRYAQCLVNGLKKQATDFTTTNVSYTSEFMLKRASLPVTVYCLPARCTALCKLGILSVLAMKEILKSCIYRLPTVLPEQQGSQSWTKICLVTSLFESHHPRLPSKAVCWEVRANV